MKIGAIFRCVLSSTFALTIILATTGFAASDDDGNRKRMFFYEGSEDGSGSENGSNLTSTGSSGGLPGYMSVDLNHQSIGTHLSNRFLIERRVDLRQLLVNQGLKPQTRFLELIVQTVRIDQNLSLFLTLNREYELATNRFARGLFLLDLATLEDALRHDNLLNADSLINEEGNTEIMKVLLEAFAAEVKALYLLRAFEFIADPYLLNIETAGELVKRLSDAFDGSPKRLIDDPAVAMGFGNNEDAAGDSVRSAFDATEEMKDKLETIRNGRFLTLTSDERIELEDPENGVLHLAPFIIWYAGSCERRSANETDESANGRLTYIETNLAGLKVYADSNRARFAALDSYLVRDRVYGILDPQFNWDKTPPAH